MADSIFDLQDNLSQPGLSGYDTFQQRLAAQRAQLEQTRPDVAAQMPTLGANTPGQQIYQAQQQQPAQDLGQTVSQLTQATAQAVTPQGAKPKEAMASQQGIEQILDYLNPLKPKQTYGPNIGNALGMGDNAGGILGLGIQPIDVLAFAIGAGLTSRLPQDQAMAMTFKIAGMPKAFRDNQEASARKFIDDQMGAMNAATAQQNAELRGNEYLMRLKERAERDAWIDSITSRLRRGTPLTATEQQMYSIGAKRAGIDPNVIKELFLRKDPAEILADLKELQTTAANQGMGSVSATFGPTGPTYKIGAAGSTGRAIQTGELSDALQTGVLSGKMQDAGFTNMDQVKAAYNERKALERERVGIAQTNSDRAQKSLEMLSDPQTKRLSSLQELHAAGTDLINKYKDSLASHGGKFSPALQLALAAAARTPDSFIGATISSLGQRFPGLNQQDASLLARYASMQKFARGMMDDVGNMSDYERGLAANMRGTPLDKPELFLERMEVTIGDASRAYEQARKQFSIARDVSAFPERLGASKQEAPSSGQPPKGATVWVMENGKLVQRKQ